MPILYEDRVVLAVDKPPGWMLAPDEWTHTGRNLPRTLQIAIQLREYWARSRNVKFLRYVHRLDAETTGILLLAKSPGAVAALSNLFETRAVEKKYLCVLSGVPKSGQWTASGEVKNKSAETRFQVLQSVNNRSLVLAFPLTGRTHQIRVHARDSGHAILGDTIYGSHDEGGLALRAVFLRYTCPFQRRPIRIRAPFDAFVSDWKFDPNLPIPL